MSLPDHTPGEDLLIDADTGEDDLPPAAPARPWQLLLGLILIALNLRPALSSLAPVLPQLRQTTGLGGLATSLLTTLPVLCMGLAAPLAPLLARCFGSERVIGGMLWLLGGGIVLRSQLGEIGLFAGTLLAGVGIGVAGVLLPGIVKRDFPDKASQLTGVYTMALCLGAALAAGLTVPLSHAFGDDWRWGLGLWSLPVLGALLAWRPQMRLRHAATTAHWQVRGLWRDRLAWQVTAYMGLQSSLAYIVFGWLPSILVERGLSATAAGWLMSLSVLVQLASALLAPVLAMRGRDQRAMVLWVMVLAMVGFAGMVFAPPASLPLWAVIQGLGQGGAFSMGLSLIVLRSGDAHVASHLSGMAQGVGYTLASLGPLAAGLLHHLSGSWRSSPGLFIAMGTLALLAGLPAARQGVVGVRAKPLMPEERYRAEGQQSTP
ncbi:MFS transporter [Pseudogulbenkiania sp. MAI-1]|uniref:CynX/NimT family MFS transporter n=1 Tax=Pseudogulbenkiania sp. MAI-1 TaxID=990370 RepID=UPI00045E9CBF|nr:MFS transporter [Pseudogulbenkiania sp. MAI-1]